MAGNPGAASASTPNVSVLQGRGISSAQFSSPTPDILSDLTSIFQTPDGQLWMSNGVTLGSIANSANSSSYVTLAYLNSALTTAVNSAQNRATQYNNMPAANAAVQSGPYAGLTVEQALTTINTALSAAGSSAPANTVQPVAATGTATVGSLQTASTGTWTGASTFLYRWYQQNATTGVRTIISGAVSSTYTAQAADFGFKLIYDVAGVSATFVTAAYVFAAGPTATIGSTLATNTGAVPAITGSAGAGSTLSLAMGGWTGATNGWSAQWSVGGIANGSPTAISLTTPITFVTDNTMVGKSVGAVVYGYNSFNVPSASPGITATGPVTVTGAAPAVTNTSPPAWPGTLQLEVQATLTPGAWTGAINTARTYNFYRNGTATANLVRSGNTVALYTPHASEGVIVGDTLYFIEFVTETATGTVYQQVSAGKVCAATPVTLTATTANTNLAWTAGSPITAVIPVTATGGTTPYTYAISPALPAGLTFNTTSGQITGTPSTAGSLTTYTVTVTDAVAATSPSTFTATVSAASVTALTAAPLPADIIVTGTSGTYNQSTSVIISSVVRIGPIADPHGSGRTLDIHRVVTGSLGTGTECRAELAWDGVINFVPATEYWMAFSIERKSGETFSTGGGNDDAMLVMQTHTPMNGDTQPPLACFYRGQSNTVFWNSSYQTAAASLVNGVYTTSTQAVNSLHSETLPAAGVMVSYIIRYRAGWTTAQSPVVEIWRKQSAGGTWTQIVTNNTNFNEYNNPQTYTRSYPRLGLYKWNTSYWNDNSIAFYMSPLYVQQGMGLYANAQQALAGL